MLHYFRWGWGWGEFAVKGIMQINMKIKYSQHKIFPLVAENKSSPFSFFSLNLQSVQILHSHV